MTIQYVSTIENRDSEIVVTTKAEGIELDRPEMVGYVVKTEALAKRLAAAIEAGVVFQFPTVRTDVNGKTCWAGR